MPNVVNKANVKDFSVKFNTLKKRMKVKITIRVIMKSKNVEYNTTSTSKK